MFRHNQRFGILSLLLILVLIFVGMHIVPAGVPPADPKSHSAEPATIPVADLPPEAVQTLTLIKQGGPFPYPKDGTTFGNREKRLPARPRGYYREYTVKTPGRGDRGARRIVAGSGGEHYYTDDHYNTFKLIKE